jgi:F0F1-type ATP synthase alpha subunit
MDIRAAEISSILKSQIANFGAEAEVTEVGTVLSVGDDGTFAVDGIAERVDVKARWSNSRTARAAWR